MQDITGYEGLYAVTENGRVWSYPKPCSSKNGMWMKLQLFTNRNNRGRPHVQYTVGLTKCGKRTTHLIHRLVAQAFIPNPENKPQINHIDGNPLNNHISNLEWVTNQENAIHASKNGLLVEHTEKQEATRSENGRMTGRMNGAKSLRKFSIEEAQNIKHLWEQTKQSFAALGREFKVSPQTIAKICYGKSYQFEVP